MSLPRLTKETVDEILARNDGLRIDKRVQGRNSHEYNSYIVQDGKMLWVRADSSQECDIDKIRSVIHSNESKFKI